jgi:hypothetical protein
MELVTSSDVSYPVVMLTIRQAQLFQEPFITKHLFDQMSKEHGHFTQGI